MKTMAYIDKDHSASTNINPSLSDFYSDVLETWQQPTHKSGRAGNGNPLQCSCLESPVDRGAWWAAVRGVA